MKPRGYTVQVEEGRVSVEHRASVRPRTLVFLGVGYLVYCCIPDVRKVLVDFCNSRDLVVGCFALFMLLIPVMSGATWLFFASGEVMSCDPKELHFARRRTLGRWRRNRFSSAQIRGLTRTFRGGSKQRSYTVLTFEYQGKTFDMLEEITWTDADRVLKACKSLGLDTILVIDDAAAMNRDIDQRGWLVNPWKSHDHKPAQQ